MKCILSLSLILLGSGFCQAISVDEIEDLFLHEKCIQGTFESASFVPGLKLLQSTNKITEAMPNAIDSEEVALHNISQAVSTSYVSKVHELAQYHNIDAEFILLSQQGEPHERVFKVKLSLGDEVYIGEAPSIKKAKQYAAHIALDNTMYQARSSKVNEEQIAAQPPTVRLNNIAIRLGLKVEYFKADKSEIQEFSFKTDRSKIGKSYIQKLNESLNSHLRSAELEHDNIGPFVARLELDGTTFYGIGNTVQGAKHNAATYAIEHLKQLALDKQNRCIKEGFEAECRQMKNNVKSPISKVHEAAQALKQNADFEVVEEHGPPHKRVFVTQCKLGDFVTRGEGPSKKESKRLAAEKMLDNLPQLPSATLEDSEKVFNVLKKPKKRSKKNKVKKLLQDISGPVESEGLMDAVWNYFDDSEGTAVEANQPGGDGSNKKTTLSSNTAATRDDSISSRKPNLDTKAVILEIGNSLHIEISFQNLGMRKSGEFGTLLSLNVNPSMLCLGVGLGKEEAETNAAFHGLKLLRKNSMLYDLLSPNKKELMNSLIEGHTSAILEKQMRRSYDLQYDKED